MFCNKCGTLLSDDSLFCTNCGSKVVKPTLDKMNKERWKVLKKVSMNPKSNIIVVVLSIIIFILGFNLEQKNFRKIQTDKNLIRITQELIVLEDSSPLLGGSYTEKQDLKKYKAEYNSHLISIIIGTALMIITVIVVVYMSYNLIIVLKKRRI